MVIKNMANEHKIALNREDDQNVMQADVLTTLAGGHLTERHRVLVTEELFVEVFRTAMHGFHT